MTDSEKSQQKADLTRMGGIISAAIGIILILVQKRIGLRIVGAIFLVDAVVLGYMSYVYNKEAVRNL